MCAVMKKSYYTIVEKYKGKEYLINTRTRAVAQIFSEEKDELLSFLSNPEDVKYKYFYVLQDNGFIVESDLDELVEMEYLYSQQFFNYKNFDITILPTLKCNFNCPYCFENEHSSAMEADDYKRLFYV